MPNLKTAGIRHPFGIVLFPVLLLLVAVLSARFIGPWMYRLCHPQWNFVYDPAPPEIPVNQETVNRLKQQMLSADDPRWMILYYHAKVFEYMPISACDYSLTTEEKKKIAHWLNDSDTLVSRVARTLTSNDFSRNIVEQLMPSEQVALVAPIVEQIKKRDNDARSQLQLLYQLSREGNSPISQQYLTDSATPSLRKLFCQSGPLPKGSSGVEEGSFHYHYVLASFRQSSDLGFTFCEYLEDSISFRPAHLWGACTNGPSRQPADLFQANDPLMRFINYAQLRTKPAEFWLISDTSPTGVRRSLSEAQMLWDRSLQERPCLMLELLATLPADQLAIAQQKMQRVMGPHNRPYSPPPPAVPSDIEESIMREMAGIHLDERAADFEVPSVSAMQPLFTRCREAALANPGRFELLWAVAKLALLTRKDCDSVKLLYLLEKNPENLARMVEFVFKLPVTPEHVELVRCMMLSSGESGFDALQPALLSAWYNRPSYAWLDAIFRSAVDNPKFTGYEVDNFAASWLEKANLTAVQKMRLRLCWPRDMLGGPVDQLDDWFKRVPQDEQIPLMRDYFAHSKFAHYRIWAAYQLTRRGEATGVELAPQYLESKWSSLHAWGILYHGMPKDEFPYESFRRFCYANPVAATRLIEGRLFSPARMDMATHDLLESMAADLVAYNFGVFKDLRAELVKAMKWFGTGNNDYWGFPNGTSQISGPQVSGGQNPAGVASNRNDFKAIAAADDANAFWALYRQSPQALWSLRPKGLGARIFLGFLNDANSTADRDQMLDELLANAKGDIWAKTVEAEKHIGAGELDDITDFPVGRVPRLTTAPQLDGQISDVEQTGILRLEPGHQDIAGSPLATAVHLAYNSDGLYLAWEAADRKERIESQTYDQSGPVFKRESFSFFIDVMRLARKLMVFTADYWGKGCLSNWEAASSGSGLQRQVPINWQGDHWLGETFLTWADLRAAQPSVGTIWRLNFRRNQIEGTQGNSYQWVEMPKNPYQPEYFGFIVFE